jgi:flagellar hook-associated protein 2
MATISSAGIGSGLDINGIIAKLMAVEQRPATLLNNKEAGFQAKLSAFGVLKGAVSAVESAARALKSPSLFSGMTVSSSDASVVSGSATSITPAGTTAIVVSKLAKAHSIASQAFPSLTDGLALADGKLEIQLGAGTPVSIDIEAAASSLEEIRDAINASSAGVRANIVYVGAAGYKLALTAQQTGAASEIKITATDATGTPLPLDNTGLARFAFDPTLPDGDPGKQFEVTTPAQDAELTVAGIPIVRSGNTISDAIAGMTITLAKEGSATLTVGRNTAAVKTAIEAFVKAYNDASAQLRDMTRFNTEAGTGSILTGDSSARGLQTALRDLVAFTATTSSPAVRSLSDVGVSMQRDGSLTFNASRFESVMKSNGADVAALFTATTASAEGIAVRMTERLAALTARDGLIAARSDGLTSSIKDLGRQREALALRLTQIEARYRRQFTALDSLVASMQQTSQYLTQQLANLSSLTKSSNN